ncbi:MAG: hypothetical protein AAB133_04905 [Pseudomonadota bacterium]
MPTADLRAARANPVFGTDEKRIRTKNRVLAKSNNALGLLLFKIVDCARMCFSSVHNRRSARTGRRPRKPQQLGDIEGHDCTGVELFYFTKSESQR